MIRRFASLCTVAALVLLTGCGSRDKAATPPSPNLLLRYHFAGTTALGTDTNGAKLRELWALPQSRALQLRTLDRLARAPQVLAGPALTPEQTEQGAALVRPLLADLIERESFLEARGTAGQDSEWLLGLALPPERAALWQTNLTRLMAAWQLGPVSSAPAANMTLAQVRRTNAPGLIRWARVGGWLLLGVGNDPLRHLDLSLNRVIKDGRPGVPLTNAWLEVEGDLTRLAKPLGLSSRMAWPYVTAAVVGRGENLRSTLHLVFPESVTGPLEPWHLPTNIICEPLISFTAWRGLRPLLGRSDTLQKLAGGQLPNEFYGWAQQPVALQSLWAFPSADPTNLIQSVVRGLPELLSESWRQRGLAQIQWQSTNEQATWRGLPLVVPYLYPDRDAETTFVVGGLFPSLRTTNPPPVDLLAQLSGRRDLLGYHWEITQARLGHWRLLEQLYAMTTLTPPLTTNLPAAAWLTEVENHLGNTITEITATSPREWDVVRKSHVGFTALELVALARWLESPTFPRPGLELPAEPRAPARPASPRP